MSLSSTDGHTWVDVSVAMATTTQATSDYGNKSDELCLSYPLVVVQVGFISDFGDIVMNSHNQEFPRFLNNWEILKRGLLSQLKAHASIVINNSCNLQITVMKEIEEL